MHRRLQHMRQKAVENRSKEKNADRHRNKFLMEEEKNKKNAGEKSRFISRWLYKIPKL